MTPVQLALTGLQLQEQGIAKVSQYSWVHKARDAAEAMCREGYWASQTVTSDDLHVVMLDTPPHPNCVGAVFKDKRFVATGERVRSTRPEAHGRWIEVWRLR